MTNTLLWHFRFSHFNEKACWALDHKGWPHRRIPLVPGFHVPRMRRMTGQQSTPVMELDGELIVDSTAIIARLELLQPDPPLYPRDTGQRRRALELEDYYDEHVGADLRRLFYHAYLADSAKCARMSTAGFGKGTYRLFRILMPVLKPVIRMNMGINRDTVARARADLGGFFDKLERELGDGQYLVGDRFTVADLAVASLLSLIVRPPQLPYELPEPPPDTLLALREQVSMRRGFRWVQEMYERHRGSSSAIDA